MNPIIQYLVSIKALPLKEAKNLDLKETDRRLKESWKALLSGYNADFSGINKNKFEWNIKDKKMVQVKNIRFYSLCEHHFMPFYGTVSISYIPSKKFGYFGLSKLPRVVNSYSRRLQSQEKMTYQIAKFFSKKTDGVLVESKAYHLCMVMRGVQSHSAVCKTYYAFGKLNNTRRNSYEKQNENSKDNP